jgi:hypothetical protein
MRQEKQPFTKEEHEEIDIKLEVDRMFKERLETLRKTL